MQNHHRMLMRGAQRHLGYRTPTCFVLALGLLTLGVSGCKPAPANAPGEPANETEASANAADGTTMRGLGTNAAEQAALPSAQAWLALIDQGRYPESWEAAADLFQSTTSSEQWQSAVKSARGPIGGLSSREFRAAEHKTSLPGAPAGNYVLIWYDSAFTGKPSAVEMVTLVEAPDTSWKVAGYFIQ